MNGHGGKRRIHAPRKLSHDQAREISVLIAHGVLGKVIADRYNVGRRTIYSALARLEAETQEPHAWAIQGCSRMWTGEYAEIDAKAEASRCGGTCYAYPLYKKE
jgi:transposase